MPHATSTPGRWRALAVAAVAVVAGAACEPPVPAGTEAGTEAGTGTEAPTTTTRPVPPSPFEVVELRLDDPAPAGGRYATFAQTGPAAVTVAVASRDGGAITEGTDREGRAAGAVRLPAFDPTAPAPRAAIRVTGAGPGDVLDPGARRFSFGADVRLDAESGSTEPGSVDNGDNVVQRGLFDDVTQFKVQVDGGRPSCRIKGRAGEVFVRSPVAMEADRWYRLLCGRAGEVVTLWVTSWDEAGAPTTVATTGRGPTGSMTPASPAVPFSAGGKLLASGAVAGSTDQLNGLLDDIVLRIG